MWFCRILTLSILAMFADGKSATTDSKIAVDESVSTSGENVVVDGKSVITGAKIMTQMPKARNLSAPTKAELNPIDEQNADVMQLGYEILKQFFHEEGLRELEKKLQDFGKLSDNVRSTKDTPSRGNLSATNLEKTSNSRKQEAGSFSRIEDLTNHEVTKDLTAENLTKVEVAEKENTPKHWSSAKKFLEVSELDRAPFKNGEADNLNGAIHSDDKKIRIKKIGEILQSIFTVDDTENFALNGSNKTPRKRTRRQAEVRQDDLILRTDLDKEECRKLLARDNAMEKRHIEDLKEQVRKLHDLVDLLKDQQQIINILNDNPFRTTNQVDKKDLVRVIKELNNRQPSKIDSLSQSKVESQLPKLAPVQSVNVKIRPNSEELQEIKHQLKVAIFHLNQTKEFFEQERHKQSDLEVNLKGIKEEIKGHKEEIGLLKLILLRILKDDPLRDHLSSNETVGSALQFPMLPHLHPLNIPNHSTRMAHHQERVAEITTVKPLEQTTQVQIEEKSRASEFSELEKLLDGLSDKGKSLDDSDDIKSKIAEIEKALKRKREKETLGSEIRRLEAKIDRLEGKSDEGDHLKLLKQLMKSLDKPQGKIEDDDIGQQLKILQREINKLRPSSGFDLTDTETKSDSDQAQFQLMLNKLLAAEGGAGRPPMNHQQVTNVQKLMRPDLYQTGAGGYFGTYGMGPFGPGGYGESNYESGGYRGGVYGPKSYKTGQYGGFGNRGYGAGGYKSGNYGPGDYGTFAYGAGGYKSDNYRPGGYETDGYGARGYKGGNYGPRGYGDRGYGTGGYGNGGYGSGGYKNGNYGPGGYENRGYEAEGYKNGNYGFGSYGNKGYVAEDYKGGNYGPGGYTDGFYEAGGYKSDNYASGGYKNDNYGSGSYGSKGYGTGGYKSGPAGYASGGYASGSYGSKDYGSANYGNINYGTGAEIYGPGSYKPSENGPETANYNSGNSAGPGPSTYALDSHKSGAYNAANYGLKPSYESGGQTQSYNALNQQNFPQAPSYLNTGQGPNKNPPSYTSASTNYQKQNFFLGPQQQGYGGHTQTNYGPTKGANEPNQDKSYAYPSQTSTNLGVYYPDQKIEDLKTQIYSLQNAISKLNHPEYYQKPEDKATVYNLEKEIDELKKVVNVINNDKYTNDNGNRPEGYNGPSAAYETPPNYPNLPSPQNQQYAKPQQVPQATYANDASNYATKSSPSYATKDAPAYTPKARRKRWAPNDRMNGKWNPNDQMNPRLPSNNPMYGNYLIDERSALNNQIDGQLARNDQENDGLAPNYQIDRQLPPNNGRPTPNNEIDKWSTPNDQIQERSAPNDQIQERSAPNSQIRGRLPSNDQSDEETASDIVNKIGHFLSNYISKEDPRPIQDQNLGEIRARVEHLKKQLDQELPRRSVEERHWVPTFPSLRSYYDPGPVHYQSYPQAPQYPQNYAQTYPQNYPKSYPQNYPQSYPQSYSLLPTKPKFEFDSKLKDKKIDFFTNIVAKIMDKLIASIPVVLHKLFGFAIDELTSYNGDGYGKGYGEVQHIFKNLGIFGYIPVIILKLLNGFTYFVQILKKNKFLKNFVLPALILLLVAGSIVFLIWWLQPDDYYTSPQNYEQYGTQQYGTQYSNNYNYKNSEGGPIRRDNNFKGDLTSFKEVVEYPGNNLRSYINR